MTPTYIKLPITFYTNDPEEIEECEKMGTELEKIYENGFIYILASGDSAIFAFNDVDDETTKVQMFDNTSTVYNIPLEDFKKKIVEADCKIIE